MIKRIKGKTKKVLAAVLAATMLLSMSGCSSFDEFYHETILGETHSKDSDSSKKDDKKEDKKDKKKDKEKDTEDVDYASEENEDFEAFLMEYFEDTVTEDTITYNDYIYDESSYGIPKPAEATWGDAVMDEAAIEREKKEDEEFYDKLMEFEDAELTEDERFTFECLKTDAEISLHYYDNVYLRGAFSPMSGWQESLPTLFTEYRFDDKGDVEDYLTLMNQTKDVMAEMLKFEKVRSEKGYFMKDSSADEVIEQCDEFLNNKGEFVISDFDEKIDAMDFLTDEEKESFKEQQKKAVEEVIIPVYEDIKATIEELKGTGTNDKGICYYDGGKEYYEDYIFPMYSGSAKTVEEEIEVIDDRYDELMMQLYSIYSSNPDAYEDFAERGDEIYSVYNDMEPSELVDMFQEKYMDDYPLEGKIPYEIDFLSDSISKIKKTTLAYYVTNPADEPDHNVIKVNSQYHDGLFNTLAHEGCPGHMFQFWYFRNTNPNPGRILESNKGYVEGWAVYTAYDVGLKCDFEGKEDNAKVFVQLEKLNSEIGYLAQERVDLGVNYEGWDLEEVKEYLAKVGIDESVAQEIMDSSIADPGVYLSYTVGYYEIEELREWAEEELGSDFDAKEFHKAILDAGPCQFGMLRKKVEKYVEENE
ncbi:MAG: DUF885 domain-containing protein [Eubacterium sp.]|nr:DUF885 domain-containing protein [Eubacterium sp.]